MATSLKNTIPFNPRSISGLQLWLDATDPNGTGVSPASGSGLSTWKDKSSNGFSGTAVNSPTYQTNVLNGLPVIRFNGTNQYINFGDILNLGTNGLSIFVVTKFTVNAQKENGIIGKTSYRGNFGRWTFFYAETYGGLGIDAFIEESNVNVLQATFAYNPSLQFNIFTNVNNRTSSSTVYYNGNLGGQTTFSLTPSNLSNTDYLFVGAYPNGVTGQSPQSGMYMNGDIAEILVYFSAVTTSQRQQVEGYLAWKWGLSSSLPSTHPFRNSSTIAPFSVIPSPIKFRSTPIFDPRSISGCQLWLDAADPNGNGSLLSNGDGVATWIDKSSNAYTVSQTTSSNRPIFTRAAQNNLPGLQFQTNTFLSNLAVNLPKFTNSAETSVFIAVRNATTNTNWNIVTTIWFDAGGNDTAGTRRYHFSFNQFTSPGPSLYANGGFVGRDSGNVISASSNAILGFTVSSSSATINTNGNLSSYSGLTLLNVTDNTALFLLGDNRNNNLLSSNIMIFEMIGYNKQVSSSERQQIEGYLAWKWGLAGNLPATHPYKNTLTISQFPYPTLIPKLKHVRFSPRQISGCQLWLDAADASTVILNGTSVTQWNDKSGNSNHAQQGTLANAPTISGSNISFNGSQWFTTPITSAPTAESFFIVLNTTKNDTIDIFAGTSSGYREVIIYLTNIYIGKWGTAPTGINGGVIATNTRLQFNYQYTQANLTFSVNGSQSGTGTPPFTYTGTNTSYIGSSTYSPNNFVGTINEIIYYNSSLSVIQRQQIEGYLAWKWGLQTSLPSTHPYAKFPPLP